jgi:hypothetical protein
MDEVGASDSIVAADYGGGPDSTSDISAPDASSSASETSDTLGVDNWGPTLETNTAPVDSFQPSTLDSPAAPPPLNNDAPPPHTPGSYDPLPVSNWSWAGVSSYDPQGLPASSFATSPSDTTSTPSTTLGNIADDLAWTTLGNKPVPVSTPGPLAPSSVIGENGYNFTADEYGRYKTFTGDLNLLPGLRDRAAQLAAGGIDRLPTDVGGHGIGTRFNGPGWNVFAQDSTLNNGAYRSLENEWARHINAGNNVAITQGELFYDQGGLRPSGMRVEYTVNDRPFMREFANVAGGASDSIATLGKGERILGSVAKIGEGLDGLGKVAVPVAVALDGARLANAYQEDGGRIGEHTITTAGSVAGGWAGALGGAAAGAEGGAALGGTIGAFFGGVGAVPGAAIGGLVGGLGGGIVGGIGGSWIGEKVAGFFKGLFN